MSAHTVMNFHSLFLYGLAEWCLSGALCIQQKDFSLAKLSQLRLNDVMSLLHCVIMSPIYSLETECMCAM